MSDDKPALKIEYLAAPLPMSGWPMDVAGVNLSRGSVGGAYRAGILFVPAEGPADVALHVFLGVADASFLRDALDEVIKAAHARQTQSN